MGETRIRPSQLHESTQELLRQLEALLEGGGVGGGVSNETIISIQRELAHLKAVSELRDRVDGASTLFYDFFDRTQRGSIAKLDEWQREVEFLEQGATSITLHDINMTLQPGMEITIQSTSDADTYERIMVSDISDDGGGNYTITFETPVQHDYPEGALLYRSKARVVEGKLTFVAERSDFYNRIYTPDVLPGSIAYSTDFSPDGQYLAVAHSNSPFLTIYKRNVDVFIKLPNPSVLPESVANSVAFSPSGNYLAVGSGFSYFINIYKREGDNFINLPNPDVLPNSTVFGVAWSPDERYLAVGLYEFRESHPRLLIYERNNDQFSMIFSAITSSDGTYQLSFSPDGQYLIVPGDTSPYIYLYKYQNNTFSEVTDHNISVSSSAYSAAWSPDGSYVAIVHLRSPYITIYKRNGDNFTRLPDPNVLPPDTARGAAWSPDGNYLVVTSSRSPYITIYKRELDDFIKIPDPPTALPGIGYYKPSFSPDGDFLAVPHSGAPYLTIYSPGSSIVPMKHTDVRFNINHQDSFSSIVAWIESQKDTPMTLECAISLHEDKEEYHQIEPKISFIDNDIQEYQFIHSGNSVHNATIRLTAVKSDPEAIVGITRLSGAVGK